MTSTKSMFRGPAVRRSIAGAPASVVGLLTALLVLPVLPACNLMSGPPPLTPPSTLHAPYGSEGHEVLWAVAPLRNESGTTSVDPMAISDKVVAAVAETKGLRCLPLNRTLETLRALNMPAVRSPADAQALAKALGVDGILVGSITAYEPYQPTFGISLALFGRPGVMHGQAATPLDARALASRPSEPAPTGPGNFAQAPLSVVSEHLDGKNHQVLLDVQEYAHGRSDPTSSLGWRRYVVSMDLYTEFAAHHALGQLLHEEASRLGPPPGQTSPGSEPKK